MNNFPHINVDNMSISKRKPICGVGINDSDYKTQPLYDGTTIICPFYLTWANMIKRCYSKNTPQRNPSYIDCTVDPRWFSFMTFRKWMITQDWEGKCLDKDILIPKNKLYSPERCVFVSTQINSLLVTSHSRRGKYPQGVRWDKDIEKFRSEISVNNKKKHLGCFEKLRDAHITARKAKAEHITNIAQTQLEPIRSALLHHARLFMDAV